MFKMIFLVKNANIPFQFKRRIRLAEKIGIAAELLDIADSILYEIQRQRTFLSTHFMFSFASGTDFIVTSQLLQFSNYYKSVSPMRIYEF